MTAGHVEEDQEREKERHDYRWDGDEMGLVLDPMSEEPEDQERRQRKEWNEFVGHRIQITMNDECRTKNSGLIILIAPDLFRSSFIAHTAAVTRHHFSN